MKGCATAPLLAAACMALVFGGCASLRALAANRDAVAAIDETGAPLGVQAAENYFQAQQSRDWSIGYTWRF